MAEHDAYPQDCIRQDITKPRYAAISATGDSNITIVNYFGGHFSTGSTESHGGAGIIRDDDCPCPYRELYPFDQNDAALFFGREAATERLRLALRRRNVLPLLGASGSGKTSLVFAGLVPLLHKEGHWRYCYFRPQTSPFMELARALLPLYAPSLNETERLGQTEQLAAQLKEKKILLSNVLAEIRHRAPHDQILLIGDQFEELYSPTLKQEERQAFLDVLFQAFAHDGFNATAGPVRLLLTMRADFLGNALAHRSFASLFQQEGEGKDDVKLGPMSELELREAIEKPAAAYGVGFESGLVERILSELATEPGYLPLMEFTLTKLWSLREGALITHEAYTGIGGVKGALAQYADGCLSDLEPAQQVETRRVFLQLVRPGEGTEDTRRLATRQELGEDHWPLVCRLADDRLVVTSRNAVGDDTVEVVHEALIRHWGKLQDWLSTDRIFRSWQERLRGSLAQWQANDYEEGGLLRGAALAVARAWLQERQVDLGTIEQEFIAASAAAEEGARRRERRRQRLLFSGLAGGLALVTVALLLAWGQRVRAQRQRGKALEAKAKLLVVEQPVDAMITALASVGPTRYGQMFPIVEHLPAIVTQVLLEGEAHLREITRLRGHRGRVRAVSLSSDGTRIVSGGEDGTVRLWDVQKGRMIGKPLYADDGWIESVSFSGDGSRILSAGHKSLRIWDVSTGNAIGRPLNDILFSDATSASLSRNGKLIVSGNSRGQLQFWDAENGEAITEGDIWGHEGLVRSVVFSKDGSRIVSAGDDGTVRLWDVKSKRAVGEPLRGHQGIVLSAAFNPDGSQIVSAGQDGTVRLWNAQSGRPIGTPLRGHNEGWVRSAAFSTDGSLIVSAGDDGTVRLWDAKSGNAIGEPLRGHLGVVMSAGMSANGRFIVSAGEDGTVRLWQKTSEAGNDMPLRGHDGEVRSAAFNSDGNLIVSGGYDGTVRLWNAKTGQQVGEPLLGHEGAVGSVAFNKEGSQIVSAGEDGTVRFWDAKTGNAIGEPLRGHQSSVVSASFSRDGRRIVSADLDGTIRIWDVMRGREIVKPLLGHRGGVQSALFSFDGFQIVSGGNDGTVRLWDAITGRQVGEPLQGHEGRVRSVAFTHDSSRIVSGGEDGTVRLWDTTSRKAIGKPLRGVHKGWVRSVAFIGAHNLIVSTGEDGTVRLWDSTSRKAIGKPLYGHRKWVHSVAVNADGSRIVTAGKDGTVRVWDPAWTDPIRKACHTLRTHQSLAAPSNDVEWDAQRTCQRWG